MSTTQALDIPAPYVAASDSWQARLVRRALEKVENYYLLNA